MKVSNLIIDSDLREILQFVEKESLVQLSMPFYHSFKMEELTLYLSSFTNLIYLNTSFEHIYTVEIIKFLSFLNDQLQKLTEIEIVFNCIDIH